MKTSSLRWFVRYTSQLAACALLAVWLNTATVRADLPPKTFFDLSARSLSGEQVSFDRYRGKVVLVVNTASKCGFTPQYAGLEGLFEKYKDQGFVVLGFPSNDFREQEPGTNAEIQSFSTSKFGVTFPLFDKGPVTGDDKQAVYRYLVDTSGFGAVMWNFEKFLIGRDGLVVDRWRSITTPEDANIVAKVEEELAKPAK